MPLSHIQPGHYATVLQHKVAAVTELMAPFSPPPPTVFASEPTGFRLRAEFRMWHDGDDLNYVMFPPGDSRSPVKVTEFLIAAPAIQALMPRLRAELVGSETLRRKLFQVEFLATLSGEVLITLVYHRSLDEAWQAQAGSLRITLQALAPHLSIIGRSRKQKLVIGYEYVRETLRVRECEYHYRQYEQAFSQPNGKVNIRMIEWACEQAREAGGDLLELYCGNGNFTLPLSRYFDHVIATEQSKSSIRAAQENLAENGIENVQLVRLSAEEVSEALSGQREFRRLQALPKPLREYRLDTLFVDPPRAGLDEHTVAMARRFPAIIYISCNPGTLTENLQMLSTSHCVEQFALFDQFPYTDHMECGVLLRRL